MMSRSVALRLLLGAAVVISTCGFRDKVNIDSLNAQIAELQPESERRAEMKADISKEKKKLQELQTGLSDNIDDLEQKLAQVGPSYMDPQYLFLIEHPLEGLKRQSEELRESASGVKETSLEKLAELRVGMTANMGNLQKGLADQRHPQYQLYYGESKAEIHEYIASIKAKIAELGVVEGRGWDFTSKLPDGSALCFKRKQREDEEHKADWRCGTVVTDKQTAQYWGNEIGFWFHQTALQTPEGDAHIDFSIRADGTSAEEMGKYVVKV